MNNIEGFEYSIGDIVRTKEGFILNVVGMTRSISGAPLYHLGRLREGKPPKIYLYRVKGETLELATGYEIVTPDSHEAQLEGSQVFEARRSRFYKQIEALNELDKCAYLLLEKTIAPVDEMEDSDVRVIGAELLMRSHFLRSRGRTKFAVNKDIKNLHPSFREYAPAYLDANQDRFEHFTMDLLVRTYSIRTSPFLSKGETFWNMELYLKLKPELLIENENN